MIATKDQERKALEEIRKIVDNLGENSYVGAAMEGVLELEDNIENDFVQSMKESVETAEKRAHELEEENERLKATKEKLEEERACILPEEVRQKFYGIAFDKKYKAQAEAMTAAERMAEAVECGENARPDAIRYRAMTEEVKEWKDIIKLLDNIARKQAGR